MWTLVRGSTQNGLSSSLHTLAGSGVLGLATAQRVIGRCVDSPATVGRRGGN